MKRGSKMQRIRRGLKCVGANYNRKPVACQTTRLVHAFELVEIPR